MDLDKIAAKVVEAKINQRDYKFWVVVDGKIESGWEYSEDAKDQLGNLPPGKKGKVLAKAGLRQLGLDPDDDNAWHKGMIASRIAKGMGILNDPTEDRKLFRWMEDLSFTLKKKAERDPSFSLRDRSPAFVESHLRPLARKFIKFYNGTIDKLAEEIGETIWDNFLAPALASKKASIKKGGVMNRVAVANELVKIARELVGAAGPLTLLEELKGNIHKLDDNKFLEMTSHGWGHTPGVDYIYGTAGNDIAHAIVGYSVGNITKEKVIAMVKKNISQAIEDNQAFKGLSGEQQETRKLWFKLMKQGKK